MLTVAGSKENEDMMEFAKIFAQRGYVTATIQYRLGMNVLSSISSERAVYRGLQDGRAAIRYFKDNAETYGIDTNHIYMLGSSAGSLQNVTLKVYDILGREVTTLINKKQTLGNYKVTFDASQISSRIYYYKLKAGDFDEVKNLRGFENLEGLRLISVMLRFVRTFNRHAKILGLIFGKFC